MASIFILSGGTALFLFTEVHMKVDLHIHSTYSDSSRSPEEIAALARERNVSLVSICDHATIEAYGTFPELCRRNGIQCVLGVELGAAWKGESVHMLAYQFDQNNEAMEELIHKQHSEMDCEYIVLNMIRDYPQMSLEDYRHFEYPREKGGWKYLYYAAARGAASTYEEANLTIFSKYAAPNELSDTGECSVQEFCRLVTQAHGVPVLAHPGYLYYRNPDGFLPMLGEMKECGLQGIECYYPSHTKDLTELCVDFCKKNDLRITAGCDCHGEFDPTEGFTIGALEVTLPMLDLKGFF